MHVWRRRPRRRRWRHGGAPRRSMPARPWPIWRCAATSCSPPARGVASAAPHRPPGRVRTVLPGQGCRRRQRRATGGSACSTPRAADRTNLPRSAARSVAPRQPAHRDLGGGRRHPAENLAAFELYGGPRALSVDRIAGGPSGWLVAGNRSGAGAGRAQDKAGAAVWYSADGREFTLVDADPALVSAAGEVTRAADVVAGAGGWVVVGARTVLGGGRVSQRPMVWRSDGRAGLASRADSPQPIRRTRRCSGSWPARTARCSRRAPVAIGSCSGAGPPTGGAGWPSGARTPARRPASLRCGASPWTAIGSWSPRPMVRDWCSGARWTPAEPGGRCGRRWSWQPAATARLAVALHGDLAVVSADSGTTGGIWSARLAG